jgi:hypothetical protein
VLVSARNVSSVFLGPSLATRVPVTTNATEGCIGSADINNDGYDDVSVAGSVFLGPDLNTKVSPPPGSFFSCLFGDVNNDDNPDVIGSGVVFLGPEFTANMTLPLVLGNQATGDVNGDGYDDVIGDPVSGAENMTSVVLGPSLTTVINLIAPTPIIGNGNAGSTGQHLASGDINNDANDDVIVGAPLAAVDDIGEAGKVFYFQSSSATEVSIDIKPGDSGNVISHKSRGVFPVAILTTDDFDATNVDPSSAKFGPDEASAVRSVITDVDGDLDSDMLIFFSTQETGIECGQAEATLTGKTLSGDSIEGSDSIRVVPC